MCGHMIVLQDNRVWHATQVKEDCYVPCQMTSGPGVQVGLGWIWGLGFEWTWLQQAGSCTNLSFVSWI